MTTATTQVDTIAAALGVFIRPGQVFELRALDVQGHKAHCRFFADVGEAALWAAEQDAAGARGVYFTPNPLNPALLGARGSARKADVLRRHWLLIDVDPVRPPDTNASDVERLAAWRVLDRCRGTLEAAGFTGAVVGDSGNGWHLCYPVDLPCEEISDRRVKTILAYLAKRCADAEAEVDQKPKAVATIWKLYGTTARKGEDTAERPYRQAQLIEARPWLPDAATTNTSALGFLAARWERQALMFDSRPQETPLSRAKKYAAKEDPAISGKEGHKRCFHVVSMMVEGFALSPADTMEAIQEWNGRCVPPWSEKELQHKIESATAKIDPAKLGCMLNGLNGHANGKAESNGTPRMNEGNSSDPLDRDATAADLIAANAVIRWGWDKWLPTGVLTVLASEPGIGKTRFCADLARRIYLGLPWPDGQAATCPVWSRTLWVPADNQHAELGSIPTEFGFPPETLYLNATRRNPFGGTMLDDPEDLKEFEARIRRVQPACVFVDTSLNATDRSSHKSEDAKAFFVPLQQIAARTGTILVCVTHLNSAGTPLGRRIMGQARLVMQLEKPDPDGQPNRRKLYVVKSNSLYPAPLGVTMETHGNEYDANPPTGPVVEPAKRGPSAEKLTAAKLWLEAALRGGPKRVSRLRTDAEFASIGAGTLYRAKEALEVEEYLTEGKKWWRLVPD